MRQAVAVILWCFLLLQCAQSKRYDNYQVIRISLNDDIVQLAHQISEEKNLDVWATNTVEGWMDVMIPPEFTAAQVFPNFTFTVAIKDVQASLDENESQRKQSRVADDFFSDFQTYGAIVAWLQLKAETSNGKATRIGIGTSYNGRVIYGLQLGNVPAAENSAFVIQCGIHAREWIAVSTCCWMIDKLLSDDINLLDKFTFIIIPSLNVDGYDYSHTADRLWRKNRQPNSGTSCVGTDLNRNYAYGWSLPGGSNNPCSETYYGPGAFSGPETRAIRDLIYKYSNDGSLVSFFDIHAYSALWMSPWGYTCTSKPEDYPEMERVMSSAVDAVKGVNGNTYVYGPTCNTVYQTSGGSRDFTYGDVGVVYSFGVEAFGSNFTPPPTWIPTIGSEIWAGVRQSVLEIPSRKLITN